MDLTIYLLTHICQDCQYKPQIFSSREEATQAMMSNYTALSDATFKQHAHADTEWARILYRDGSFDEFEIFTIDIRNIKPKR